MRLPLKSHFEMEQKIRGSFKEINFFINFVNYDNLKIF